MSKDRSILIEFVRDHAMMAPIIICTWYEHLSHREKKLISGNPIIMAISKTKPWMSAELVATDIDRNLMKVGSVSTCRIIALINVLSMLVCTHIICIESPSCVPHSPPPTTMKIHATVRLWLHDIEIYTFS